MTVLRGFAPAKVNLTLHVTGQRADGYHLLDSLAVFADIGDVITAKPSDDLMLSVSGPFAGGVPTDDRNLMIKAAQSFGPERGAHLTLEKNLPHPAGIGGGSADAAATLRLLSQLWQRPLPSIEKIAALGADVPVCLSHSPQHMFGIGDQLSAVPSLPSMALVLVNPGVDVPTPAVFQRLTQKTNAPMPPLPESDFRTFIHWVQACRNDLEAPALQVAPIIQNVLTALEAHPTCALARMSGSGATCFGVFETPELATTAAEHIAQKHPEWWVKDANVL